MNRFTLASLCVLLLCVSTGLAAEAGFQLVIGPDGKIVAPGKYWLLQTYDDGRPPTVVLLVDTTNVDSPGPVPNLERDIQALIDAVVDPDKATTRGELAEVYRQILVIVESGILTTPDNVRTAAKYAVEAYLKTEDKTQAWASFVRGMETLAAPMDIPKLRNAYQVAERLLRKDAPPPPPPQSVARVTYVYEKDDGSLPVGVVEAFHEINAAGDIIASEFEQNTVDGDGEVPQQYQTALAQAKDAGLPAAVIEYADGSVAVIQAPTTKEQILAPLRSDAARKEDE